MATKNTVFSSESPISGGNNYTLYSLIEAVEQNINARVSNEAISKAISKTNLSNNRTYNTYWLLNFQADYFSNLVDFKLDNYQVNRQVAIAIRLGIIYGSSVLWKRGNQVTAMYVNNLELDEAGSPKRVKMYRGDYVLMSQSLDFKKDGIQWIERDVSNDENFFIFIPNDYNLGGLIKWMPFIIQLENLLKMLNTHSYSYLKSILFNVKDKDALLQELELYFNPDNPFLINTGDESVLSNKFKEFQIHKDLSNTDGLIEFIKEFLNIYYDLIGRRYNSDRKNERNITSEVNASQENYDILQRSLKRNINYMLEFIEEKWGYKNMVKEQENQKTTKQEGVIQNPIQDENEAENAL